MSCYFRPAGPATYAATEHTGGAWSTEEQHVSPLCGLMVHVLETALPRPDLVLGRLSTDILGVVPVAEVEVRARVLRAGRRVELDEVEAVHDGRAVARARAWRLAATDTGAVAAVEQQPVPGPDELPPWSMSSVWPGGYIASLEVRREVGARPGRGVSWISTPLSLVEDAGVEQASPLARWVGLLDTANGTCVRVDPQQWSFPNVDLTLHLHRTPVGPPLGLDTAVSLGAGGVGLTSSVVHDVDGPVGTLAQVLTLRELG